MAVEEASEFVSSLTRALAHESTTQASMYALEGVISATEASAGRIFLLDLRTGCFKQRAQLGHDAGDDIPPFGAAGHAVESSKVPADVLEIAARSKRRAWWARDARSAPSVWHEPSALRRLVHPVLRGSTAIALIDIESPRPLNLDAFGPTSALMDQVIVKI
jgi:hypothetical protein